MTSLGQGDEKKNPQNILYVMELQLSFFGQCHAEREGRRRFTTEKGEAQATRRLVLRDGEQIPLNLKLAQPEAKQLHIKSEPVSAQL